MPKTIGIIGDGAMATVCGMILTDSGHHVKLYSMFDDHLEAMRASRRNERYLPDLPLPEAMVLTEEPGEVFADADFVLSAMPCQFIRAWWGPVVDAAARDVPVCSITKGIENGSLLRPSEVLRDLLGPIPVAALSGPNIGPELARRLPATAVVAGEDESLARFIQEAFATDWFRVYTNVDLVGVELAGAVKNVIALAAGAVDGLGAGCNAKAALLTRGIAEIARLGDALGARRETFAGLAGLGDLVTTCISPVGRNRSTGERIGRGETVEHILQTTTSVVEGLATTKSVMQLAERHGVEMPITAAIHAVLFEGRDVRDAITDLMGRRLRSED